MVVFVYVACRTPSRTQDSRLCTLQLLRCSLRCLPPSPAAAISILSSTLPPDFSKEWVTPAVSARSPPGYRRAPLQRASTLPSERKAPSGPPETSLGPRASSALRWPCGSFGTVGLPLPHPLSMSLLSPGFCDPTLSWFPSDFGMPFRGLLCISIGASDCSLILFLIHPLGDHMHSHGCNRCIQI